MNKLYRRRVIKIKALIPRDENEDVIAGFICDALQSWGGQFDPDEPLFESLSVESVTIGKNIYENPQPKEMDE